MRHPIRLMLSVSALAVLVLASHAIASAPSEEETEAILAEISRRMVITSERVDNEAVSDVFDAIFYKAKLKWQQASNSTQSMNIDLIRHKGDFVMLEMPMSTQEMPGYLSLVRPDFQLKTDADAKKFEAALDVLLPVWSSNEKHKEIRREGNTWTFVRGTFFKKFKGVILETNDAGSIIGMSNSLKVPPKTPATDAAEPADASKPATTEATDK